MIETLTPYEYEVAQLASLGVLQKEIAHALRTNRIRINNTMRGVHRKLGTDEHTLAHVFLGEKHGIPDIAEPLTRYDFFVTPMRTKVSAVVDILLVLSMEFFSTNALRVRRAARARRSEMEYVFACEIEGYP